jgi:hypothetical protein
MDLELEIWKDIPGYEGFYMASTHGRIKSIERVSNANLRYKTVFKGKILKGRPDGHGYEKVALWNYGKRKDFRIHKLIAITFLNHKPNGMTHVVDHIDANKLNNNINNLQIITNRENCSKGWAGKKTSQYTGVYKCQKYWIAQITINWKCKQLGKFKNEHDAHLAYQKALKELT